MTKGTTLPEPKGWKLLIEKIQPKQEKAGGILLPDQSIEAESYMQICGKVTAIGPMAWCDRDTGEPWTGGPWAEVGDWVIIPKFTQFKLEVDGTEYRFINDDEIIATTDEPESIKVYT